MKLFISTDNSVNHKVLGLWTNEPDDSLALAVLLAAHRDKKMEIVGISSTFGNANGNSCYHITQNQIALSRLRIPVLQGASFAGQYDSPAVNFLSDYLGKTTEKVALVGLGPVTDYAAVFHRHPQLLNKVNFFYLVRSGPYLNQKFWYLCSVNALKDVDSAKFMYQLGANKFQMGKEIFSICLDNQFIRHLQNLGHPMMKFITQDLNQWNLQNKIIPNKGFFARRGNMCPWDLVWSMYLVEPQSFTIEKKPDLIILHPKTKDTFLEMVRNHLAKWESMS